MREPWDLTSQFVQMMSNAASQDRNSADNFLMKMIGTQLARQDAGTAQGYNLETLGVRNKYATEADTIAYGRQQERDTRAFNHEDATLDKRRGWDLSDAERDFNNSLTRDQRTQQMTAEREALARGEELAPRRYRSSGGGGSVDPSIVNGIAASARALGISPIDLATAISYETGGTFNPTQAGPYTQWGRHRGLIQFGEPQARENGVNWDDPINSQLGENGAVVKYLRNAGVRPGMSLLDVYSAINAGAPGKYDASDAGNGGAPGSVRDKVEKQMGYHRKRAEAMFGASGGEPLESVDGPTTTTRRYTDEGGGTDYSRSILSDPSPNSGGGMDERNVTVDPAMQQYLDANGVEVVGEKYLTQSQLDLMPPDMLEQFIPDPYSKTSPKAPSRFLQVKPRAKSADELAATSSGQKVITADKVEVQKSPKPVYKDGRVYIGGRELELPN